MEQSISRAAVVCAVRMETTFRNQKSKTSKQSQLEKQTERKGLKLDFRLDAEFAGPRREYRSSGFVESADTQKTLEGFFNMQNEMEDQFLLLSLTNLWRLLEFQTKHLSL